VFNNRNGPPLALLFDQRSRRAKRTTREAVEGMRIIKKFINGGIANSKFHPTLFLFADCAVTEEP
jgi:hypothetical protein